MRYHLGQFHNGITRRPVGFHKYFLRRSLAVFRIKIAAELELPAAVHIASLALKLHVRFVPPRSVFGPRDEMPGVDFAPMPIYAACKAIGVARFIGDPHPHEARKNSVKF